MRTRGSASTVLGAMLAAGLMVCATAAWAVVSIDIGSAEGDPNSIVEVTVTMGTGGADVAGVQNDIIFDPTLVSLSKASDCAINAAIGDKLDECEEDPPTAPCKQLQRNLADCPAAAGCPEGSDGMKRFRGIILSTSNVNTIPDGALYTCKFTIVSGESRSAVLTNLNLGSSDAGGNALETTGSDGQIQIMGEAGPTPTPTEEEEACPTPAAGAVVIEVGRANVDLGTATVDIPVTMATADASIAGVQNDIIFDPAIVDLTKSGDCTINADIGDKLDECEEDPPTAPCKQLQRNLADCPAAAGCPEGSEGLKRFRGIILSTSNVNEIPDGVLYTCKFTVVATTPATAVLQNLNFGSSDPGGNAITTDGCDGKVVIGGVVPPTETPGEEDTPTPTETPTIAPPTNTPVPATNTPVPATRTNTPAPSSCCDDDDGCQITAPSQSAAGWMLLIPLVGLLWLRRRGR